MICFYCKTDVPMVRITFVPDGMVPGISMPRRRARCHGCRNTPPAIDGKPSEQPTEKEYPF